MSSEKSGYSPKLNKIPLNMPESVAVSVEALSILGLDIASNPESLSELLTVNYSRLANGQSRPGEPFVQLSLDNDYQLRIMLEKIDKTKYNGHTYPRFSNWYKSHWTSTPRDIKHVLKSLTHHDKNDTNLGRLNVNARLALSDGDGIMKPFIHYADRPFDDENIDLRGDDMTQLDAFAIEKNSFETTNPDYNMTTMDVASYAMLTLQKRIKGESMQDSLGTMIVPDLGKKMALGGSVVNIVHTGSSGQIGLGWSRGNPDDGTGFGLSIGLNK